MHRRRRRDRGRRLLRARRRRRRSLRDGSGRHGFTGLDALDGAGFSVAGTQRWGLQFVCRIQGRPSAREDLAIPGDDSYHERAPTRRPRPAYWSYWYASNGGAWKYTSVAAASHSTVEGGFEGWSFHRLRVRAPTRGGAEARSRGADVESAVEAGRRPRARRHGRTDDRAGWPDHEFRDHGSERRSVVRIGGQADTAVTMRRPTDPGGPTKTPGPSTPTPTTMQADGPKITTALPEQPDDGSSGSAAPFLIGAGILTLLGAGAGATAWRRSHRG